MGKRRTRVVARRAPAAKRRGSRSRVRRAQEAAAIGAAFIEADKQVRANARKTTVKAVDPVTGVGGSTLYRCRMALRPWLITAGLAGVAEASWALHHYVAAANIAPNITAVAAVGSAVVVAFTCLMRRDRLSKERRIIGAARIRLVAGCVVAAAWMLHTAPVGLTYGNGLVLLVAEFVFAARWWRRHTIGDPDEVVEVSGQTIPELFADNCAGKGGFIDGARMMASEAVKYGTSYTIQLVPGKQTLRRVLANLELLASGLRRPVEQLVIEHLPAPEGQHVDPSLIRMQVLVRSPIKKTIWFPGPTIDAGRIRLGQFADGDGSASIRLYTDDSIWGGFLLGSMGAGKSRALECIAISIRSAPHTVLWVADGQDGASSTAMFEHADWAVGRSGSDAMLAALEGIIDIRQIYNNTHVPKLDGFTPSAEMPGLVVIVDECQEIFRKDVAERWGDVQRKGRKVGVTIWAATQISKQTCFGGSEALRSNLYAGNLIVMRCMSKGSVALLPGKDGEGEAFDPTQLPELPGYAYLLGKATRNAPMRFWYIPSVKDKAAGLGAEYRSVAEWFAATETHTLDAVSATHAGDAYVRRAQIAADLLAENQAVIADARNGIIRAPKVDKQTPATVQNTTGSDDLTIATYPEFHRPAHLDGQPVVLPADLTDSQAKVYRAVAAGAVTNLQIQEVTSLGERRIRDVASELIEAGHVEPAGRGRYVLPEQKVG